MKPVSTKLFRFEFLAVVLFLCMANLVVQFHVPYAAKLIKQGKNLYGFWDMDARTVEVHKKKMLLQKENRLLDSLIKSHEQNMHTDENSVAATLYQRAEASGVKTSKIEISEKGEDAGRFETPVSVRGTGTYSAMGSLCEAIENFPAPARIRLISAQSTGNRGILDVFIDFSFLSQRPAKEK